MISKSNFVNGLPELLLLQLLSRKEMYGYQLVAEIRAHSREVFQFGEGCIYPILHRLAAQGHLSTRRETVDGRPRYYYKTSAKGRKYAESLMREWRDVISGAEAVLEA